MFKTFCTCFKNYNEAEKVINELSIKTDNEEEAILLQKQKEDYLKWCLEFSEKNTEYPSQKVIRKHRGWHEFWKAYEKHVLDQELDKIRKDIKSYPRYSEDDMLDKYIEIADAKAFEQACELRKAKENNYKNSEIVFTVYTNDCKSASDSRMMAKLLENLPDENVIVFAE